MILGTDKLTHESLMFILPAGAVYACQEDGRPSADTVLLAIALHAIKYVFNPTAAYQKAVEN